MKKNRRKQQKNESQSKKRKSKPVKSRANAVSQLQGPPSDANQITEFRIREVLLKRPFNKKAVKGINSSLKITCYFCFHPPNDYSRNLMKMTFAFYAKMFQNSLKHFQLTQNIQHQMTRDVWNKKTQSQGKKLPFQKSTLSVTRKISENELQNLQNCES